METEAKTGVTAGAPAAGVPAQMTREQVADEIGKGLETAPAPVKAGEPVKDEGVPAEAEIGEKTAEVEAEAGEKKEEATATEAKDEGVPDKAKVDVIEQQAAADKAALEAAQAEATAAKTEAETLRAQIEAGRADQILKTGLKPELLTPEAAETIKQYDTTLAQLTSAKDVLKFCRTVIEDAQATGDHAKLEETFSGQNWNDQPFKGTVRQWRDLAEDARDNFDAKVREIAPIASTAKREAAQREAEIYKLGLAAFNERKAAAAKVAATVTAKKAAPAKIEVKAAMGTRASTGPKSKADQVMGAWENSKKGGSEVAAALGELLAG